MRGPLLVLLFLIASAGAAEAGGSSAELIRIPGGTFTMGDPAGEPDEAPRTVHLAPFRLMRFEVTNLEFADFVASTGTLTDAERVGAGYVWTGRWRTGAGADWRHPHGPESSVVGRDDHPVVQVSARDAARFCAHYGLRLPPVIVVRDAAQARLDAANHQGHIPESFAQSLAVYNHCPIRSTIAHIACRVGVVVTPFSISGVTIDHQTSRRAAETRGVLHLGRRLGYFI